MAAPSCLAFKGNSAANEARELEDFGLYSENKIWGNRIFEGADLQPFFYGKGE